MLLTTVGLGLDGDTDAGQTISRQGGMQLVGERLRCEGTTVDAFRCRLEHPGDGKVRGRATKVGGMIVDTGGKTVSELTVATETTDHITGGEGSEVTEGAEAEANQDIGERRTIERRDRERPEKGRAGTDRHDEGTACRIGGTSGESCGEDAVGDPHSDLAPTGEDRSDIVENPGGHGFVTAEEPRRTTRGEGDDAGAGNLDPWRQTFERGRHRFEQASFAVGITFEYRHVGATALRVPAPLPQRHPFLPGRGR